MTKQRRISIMIAVVLLVLGLGSYGTYSLMDKMKQVKELNGQIAEADESGDQPDSDDEAQPGGSGDGVETPADSDADGDGGLADGGSAQGGGVSSGSGVTAGSGNGDGAGKPSAGAGQGSTGAGQPTTLPSASAPAAPGKGGPSSRPGDGQSGGTGTKQPESTPATVDPEQRKQAIDESVTASMESLRLTCKAKSASLVAQIKADVRDDKESAIETIQKEYLGKIAEAEASCDSKFSQLVGEATSQYKEAGLEESRLPDWSSEYEKAKAEARSNALMEIASVLK